eukprot:s2309_g14.t1
MRASRLIQVSPPFSGDGASDIVLLKVMRALKSLRALRIVRSFRFLSGLRVLVKACQCFLPSLFWAMVLLSIFIFMGAMIMANALHAFIIDPAQSYDDRVQMWTLYGTAYRSAYTIYEVTFAGNWPTNARPVLNKVSQFYSIFFVVYVTIIVFALIRIISAIFLKEKLRHGIMNEKEDTLDAAQNDAEHLVVEKMHKKADYVRKLEHLFQAIDASGSGLITEERLTQILGNPKVAALFQTLDLDVHESEALFHLLDDGDGEVTLAEFIDGVMRCKGPARAIDQVAMHAEMKQCGGTPCAGLLVETKRCWKNCTEPVDCLMGDWGLWEPSECLASSDQRQRERAVVRAATNGGEPCTGMIRETMGCSEVGDAVADCELSAYGEWSVCTTSCGSGLRTRSRSIEVQASGGGQPCQGPLALLEPCNLGPCPCEVTDASFSQWEEWSGCNGGMHIRKRKVQQQASCGGDPALGSLTEIRNCGGTIDCEVSPWASWDECDKSCGGGQQERNRQVTQNPQNGGKPCLKDLVETQGCNEIPCQTTSCEVSDWSAWGECSNSCGSGVHERSRTFTHLAEEGGSGCDMPMAEIKPCSDEFGTLEARRLELCPMSDCGCVWRDWSEWSACTCECGGGQKTRNRHIARAPQPGCTPCEPFDKQQIEPCNTQKCEEDECVDALWSPWQDWEPCSISCRGGITWRSRRAPP